MLQLAAIGGGPARLRFQAFADAAGPVTAGPRARQRIRKIVRGQPIIGGDDETALQIRQLWHALERDHALPLMPRIPAGPIATFGQPANRNAADRLMADVPVPVGEDEVERRHPPRSGRLPQLHGGAGAVHAEHAVSQPQGSAPSQRNDTGPVSRAAAGSTSSTIGPLREERTILTTGSAP